MTSTTNEAVIPVRMIGHMAYGPTDESGQPARVLNIGEVHHVPAVEAEWLMVNDLAELV
ncbi:hypothetical protein ABCR94_24940 [Streptomyces sp. 21So2-11]|uniref:hypothetical protein n=1 Tax=Streptomyces sp. 21So2-11 TaxID=3144408 RepID=UPI00321BBA5E